MKEALNIKIIITFCLLFVVQHAWSQKSSNIQADTLKYCVTPKVVGTGTFDPVSYFENNAPISGKESISSTYEGVTYWFANLANKKKFDSNPTAYLPQFGGWCSMTLAMGRATIPKYDNFLVSGGKLYLFERTLSVNGKELWIKDVEANEKIALKNYEQYKSSGKIN